MEALRLAAIKRKKERRKKHAELMAKHKEAREQKAAARAERDPQHLAETEEAQANAIQRHQREVELGIDISSMQEQIREMLSEHGEIESVKKTIKGELLVRFATVEAAKSLLKTKKETTINASLSFPITPVVIKQHSMYYKPNEFVIDQEVLNATAEHFSSISVVQQVKKNRNAVLIVFEDTVTRDQMVEQSKEDSWTIMDHPIVCHAGLPPAINKRKPKSKPNQQPKKKKKANGVH